MRLLLAGPGVATTPSGRLFDVILLLHVACVVVGLLTVVVSGAEAARCRASWADPPPAARRYFAGGTNWAGRVLYGVPIFGFVLIGLSHGAYRLSDTWVSLGLALWAVGAVAAEVLLWPAERRIAALVGDAGAGPGPPPGGSGPGRVLGAPRRAGLRQACALVSAVSAALAVMLVGASVMMVAKP